MKLKNKKTGETITLKDDRELALLKFVESSLPNGFILWEEVKETTSWKPELGKKYYLSDSNGSVYDSVWSNDYIDRSRFEIGNCFENREEAEKAIERLKAWERLKNAGLKFKDWNKSNYDKTFCINADVEHDVTAFEFFKDLRTALDMEISDEAQK